MVASLGPEAINGGVLREGELSAVCLYVLLFVRFLVFVDLSVNCRDRVRAARAMMLKRIQATFEQEFPHASWPFGLVVGALLTSW